jgi:hypothetical protein
MKIIPRENIEFITDYTFDEIRKILIENVEPKKGVRLNFNKTENDKIFEGKINSDNFVIQKVIYYRNSFLPQIYGKWESINNESKVTIRLKLHNFTYIFAMIWITFVSIAFIFTLIGILEQGTNPIFGIVPVLMIIFGILLFNYGFEKEKKNSISDLKRILNAQSNKTICQQCIKFMLKFKLNTNRQTFNKRFATSEKSPIFQPPYLP